MSTLEERFWAKVERGSGCWEWTAQIQKGYGKFHVSRSKKVLAHRHVFEMTTGPIPIGMHIDHMCHNRSCVNPSHLRLATPKQNMENRNGAHINSKSGIRGVSWDKGTNKWRAQLMHDGKKISIGHFLSIADAEQAAITKRNELFTHNDMDRKSA